MKKRTFYALFFTTLLSCLVISCASLPQVNLTDYSPLAVATVYANTGLPWYEEDRSSAYDVQQTGDGLITGIVNRAIDSKNPEYTLTQERIDGAEKSLASALRMCGVSVIQPSTNPDFSFYKKNSKASGGVFSGTSAAATGYHMRTNASRALARKISQEAGAKSILYAAFTFQKVKVSDDGLHIKGLTPRVSLKVFASDASGKIILNSEYKSNCREWVSYRTGDVYDKEELCALIPSCINDVVYQFTSDFCEKIEGVEPVLEDETSALVSDDSASAASRKARVTAKRLLNSGFTVEETAELTGLSENEVNKLLEEN
ncbi:hypothetical protein MSI_18900 [Treponema sp. JC4]|uniref:hypothetical protein n=1 Tax=Treponema sp. JC4 TaxID=1124982 RepID=UPI00025B0C85|nr:hypothetical protein [Treponema sp. JC4]EID84600.1 hypothetical protein MSI_18900 [Treponema sp. JC4]